MSNGSDFLFGLARNTGPVDAIATELAEAREHSQASGRPARFA